MLKYVKSSLVLQFTHDTILGGHPNMHNSRSLNIYIVKSKSFSVSDIVYSVFKSNCNML